MKYDPKIVISDIKTYQIMSNNKNYADRLFEAYQYVKSKKLNTLQKFMEYPDNLVGLFSYQEITIFDRLKDEEYSQIIKESWQTIHRDIDDYIKEPNIGDTLASYGRLGYTPKRVELISKGYIFTNLTDEEQSIRDQALKSMQDEILKRNTNR